MTWPASDVNTSNVDSGTDNPANARADFLDLIQKFNQLRNHVSAFAQTFLDDADAAAVRASLGGLVTLAGSETLTNKTITSPVINTPTGDVATLTGSQTLTNKTLTTPVINSATGVGQSIQKRKTADESVTSSTTLQNDDHLSFSIGANEEWIGTITVFMVGSDINASGVKCDLTAPFGTINGNAAGFIVTNSAAAVAKTGSVAFSPGAMIWDTTGVFAGASETILKIEFWVKNGSNAGTVQLRWAQSTSSGSALRFNQGSNLVAFRIA